MPVIKQNGDILVCADSEFPTNQVYHVESYLPHVGDIFLALSGGKAFSNLDLSLAYLQLGVEDECKKLLTNNTHKRLFENNRLVILWGLVNPYRG